MMILRRHDAERKAFSFPGAEKDPDIKVQKDIFSSDAGYDSDAACCFDEIIIQGQCF